jgi:predicted  nucleic acid-binding Zn-ribbon protein
MAQLDLFPFDEDVHLWSEILDLKESHSKVRKRLFAELTELKAQIAELKEEHAQLQKQQKRNSVFTWI